MNFPFPERWNAELILEVVAHLSGDHLTWPGVEPTTSRSWVQRFNRYATEPYAGEVVVWHWELRPLQKRMQRNRPNIRLLKHLYWKRLVAKLPINLRLRVDLNRVEWRFAFIRRFSDWVCYSHRRVLSQLSSGFRTVDLIGRLHDPANVQH